MQTGSSSICRPNKHDEFLGQPRERTRYRYRCFNLFEKLEHSRSNPKKATLPGAQLHRKVLQLSAASKRQRNRLAQNTVLRKSHVLGPR